MVLLVDKQHICRERKGEPAINCMCAFDFDMKFTFACVGQEGSAYDTRIFLSCLNNENNNFPKPPPSMYCCILGCVWLSVKYFGERKIFSSVWLHSKKYFGKYFLVFGCVAENALENPFLSCFSHFLRIRTNIITENQNI